MKQYYLLLIGFILFSCCNKKIPATIKAESIEVTKGGFHDKQKFFTMTISSNINLATYYKEKKAVNFFMFCPLVSETFPNKIELEPFSLEGFLNEEENVVINENRFYNSFSIYFENNEGETLNDEKIKSLLNGKNCIDCKLIMPLYVLGPREESEKFCIPTKMILESLNE